MLTWFVSFAITLWEMVTRHKPRLETEEEGQSLHNYAVLYRMDHGKERTTMSDRETNRQTDRQTDKQTDRWTKTDRQTDRQTDFYLYR